jgi:hypothetical protein
LKTQKGPGREVGSKRTATTDTEAVTLRFGKEKSRPSFEMEVEPARLGDASSWQERNEGQRENRR